jgi:hypothetical protein
MRTETTFTLVHQLIAVDAILIGPTGGAAMTTVAPRVAESVGFSPAHSTAS